MNRDHGHGTATGTSQPLPHNKDDAAKFADATPEEEEKEATSPTAQFEIDSDRITDQAIAIFDRRFRNYSIISACIIAVVFGLLATAGYIFFFAQNIQERGGTAIALDRVLAELQTNQQILQAAETELAGVTQELAVGSRTTLDVLDAISNLYDIRQRIALLEGRRELVLNTGYVGVDQQIRTAEEAGFVLATLQARKVELDRIMQLSQDRFEVGEVTRTDLAQSERAVRAVEARIASMEIGRKQLPTAREFVEKTGDVDVRTMISTNIVRFGGVSVILFLIAILIPIYRYNIRLANYYLARADALRLCRDLRCRNIKDVVALFTPVHAFEKQPVTPLDGVIDAVAKNFRR